MASLRDRFNSKGEYIGTSVLWRKGTEQHSKKFRSSAEATAYIRKLDAGLAADVATNANMRFDNFVEGVWLRNAGLAASTKRAVESAMRNDLKPLADKSVMWVALNRTEVALTIAASKRSDHGLLYMICKCACDEAVACGIVDSHKLAGLKVKRNTNRREIIPTTAEQRDYIASQLGKHGLIVHLMHGTGIRIGEALALRGSDFRDGFKTVRVGRKADKGSAAPLKHRRPGQFRDVPVPAWLAAKVKAYVAANGLGPLFPGQRGKEFLSYEAVATPIKRAAVACGLPPEFSPHQFRHAFASTLLANGMGIIEVAEWLGDGVKVVQETYAHVLPAASDRARAILDAAL